jgi:hypothetical protein
MHLFESVHKEILCYKTLPKKDRDMVVMMRTQGCVESLKEPLEHMYKTRHLSTDRSLQCAKYKYDVYCAILKKDKDAAEKNFTTLREISLEMLEEIREGNYEDDVVLFHGQDIYTGDKTKKDENLRQLAKSMQSTFNLMEGLMELTFQAPWI